MQVRGRAKTITRSLDSQSLNPLPPQAPLKELKSMTWLVGGLMFENLGVTKMFLLLSSAPLHGAQSLFVRVRMRIL